MGKDFFKLKKGEKPIIRFLPHPKKYEPSPIKIVTFKGSPEDYFKKLREEEIRKGCIITEHLLMNEVNEILNL